MRAEFRQHIIVFLKICLVYFSYCFPFFSLPLISCHDVLLGLHSKEMEVSCFDMVTWWCSTHEIKTLSIRMQKSNGDCLHPLS